MKFPRSVAVSAVAAVAATLTLSAAPAAARGPNGRGPGGPKPAPPALGRPGAGRADLAITGAALLAAGRVDVKRFSAVGRRPQREWLRVQARHLDPAKTYTLWLGLADDPATVETDESQPLTEVATFFQDAKDPAAPGDDAWLLRFDTRGGALLPFGVGLARLEGVAIEVRESDGDPTTITDVPVLQGAVPAVGPVRRGRRGRR